jgi:hypothetical protein
MCYVFFKIVSSQEITVMLKNIKIIAVIVATTCFTAAAQAGIQEVVTPIVPAGNFVGPWAGLNGGDWFSFQVDVQTDNGALITAVDVTFNGVFHQTWNDTDFDDSPNPSPTGPAGTTTGDSYLTPLVGALTGSAPLEDNNGVNGPAGSPLVDTFVPGSFAGGFDHGVGSFMTGAWGVPGPSQTTAASLAKLVVPAGTSSVRMAIATSNGTFQKSFDIIAGEIVPEPTTLALASLSMVGLAGLRRRR